MKSFYALFMFALILIGGCSGKQELNELLILTGIGIDQGEEQNVKVTFQATNPQAQAGGEAGGGGASQATSYTFESEGEDVVAAVFNANDLLPRKLFFPHISSLVVGEDFARENGLAGISDFLSRHYEIRDSYMLFIAKETTASDILNTFPPLDNSSVQNIKRLVEIPGSTVSLKDGIELEDFIRWRYGDDRDAVITGVERVTKETDSTNTESLNEIEGNKNALRLTGLALFDEDYLVDWLSYKDSVAWAMIKGESETVKNYTVPCSDSKGTIGFLLKEMDVKAKPKIEEDQLTYTLQMKGHFNLQGMTCNIDLSTDQGVTELQDIVNTNLEDDLQTSVENAQDFNLDYFGIKNDLFKNQPKQWEKAKDDWEDLYAQMETTTNVDLYLESPGARVDNNEEK
ncbi:Ger(x)C family spore germination protein [Halobacillus sp. B23F22_1]|uniref:Ger(x)C family spore germination protein n=1 Tax=Halobacillus sp. B23F22_1 TaxID=3459514 RepID=UPI00373F7AF6